MHETAISYPSRLSKPSPSHTHARGPNHLHESYRPERGGVPPPKKVPGAGNPVAPQRQLHERVGLENFGEARGRGKGALARCLLRAGARKSIYSQRRRIKSKTEKISKNLNPEKTPDSRSSRSRPRGRPWGRKVVEKSMFTGVTALHKKVTIDCSCYFTEHSLKWFLCGLNSGSSGLAESVIRQVEADASPQVKTFPSGPAPSGPDHQRSRRRRCPTPAPHDPSAWPPPAS